MKEIGGFFELELDKKKEFHGNAIKLNTGSACLRYILKVKSPQKIYLPYYSCDSILNVIIDEKIDYEFYNIDEYLNPIITKKFNLNDYIIYINYFGIKNNTMVNLSKKYQNLIADNTQAFFYKPINSIDTFYSPRKFFGVPDGGYLYTDSKLKKKLDKDSSYKRFKHLLLRVDDTANFAYEYYLENEELLKSQTMKYMSKLTMSILKSIDYTNVEKIRKNNFWYLHNYLKKYNELKIVDVCKFKGPMVYPFVMRNDIIKCKLIDKKIYIPTYWEEVLLRTNNSDYESYLAKYLIPLPIDQRYGKKDMKRIIDIIFKFI